MHRRQGRTVKVKFVDVGRNDDTWTANLPDTEPETLVKEAKKALMSNCVTCVNGKIYAGIRPVGAYEILDKGDE